MVHLRMLLPRAPWTRALEAHTVSAEGITWEFVAGDDHAPDRFASFAGGTADVGETNVRRAALARLKGGPAVGIPVFLTREHMQRNLLVHRDSPLHSLGELPGKRVVTHVGPVSGTATGVMLMLERAYGVSANQIEWWVGDQEGLLENRMGLRVKRGSREESAALRVFEAGEGDALMVTSGPRYHSLFGEDSIDEVLRAHPGLRPVVSEPQTMAHAYRQTRIYPITDIVTLRPELAADRDLPGRLVDLFSRANEQASAFRSREEEAMARREVELLGEDPHVYGLTEGTRRTLASYLDLLYRVGALPEPFEVEDLFAPSSL